MNRMRHILFFLPVAMLLAACSQDDSTLSGEAEGTLPEPIPLQLTAAIGEAVATPATRGTVDGQWPTEGGTVYVQISETEDGFDDNNVLKYAVDASGNLKPKESKDIYYWEKNDQTLYVRAWYPGGKTSSSPIPKDGNKWTAGSNQSNEADLAKDDFLYAYKYLTFGSQPYTLEFKHLMSKITINIVNSDYLKQYDPAKVSVSLVSTEGNQSWIIQGSFRDSGSRLALKEASAGNTASSIVPFKLPDAKNYYASYEAIVIPQGVTNYNKGIQVKVDNAIYQWKMTLSDNSMKSGMEYTFNITVKEQGLTVKNADPEVKWISNSFTGTVTPESTN